MRQQIYLTGRLGMATRYVTTWRSIPHFNPPEDIEVSRPTEDPDQWLLHAVNVVMSGTIWVVWTWRRDIQYNGNDNY